MIILLNGLLHLLYVAYETTMIHYIVFSIIENDIDRLSLDLKYSLRCKLTVDKLVVKVSCF